MLTVWSVDLLTVSTVPLASPGPLLELLPEQGPLAWVRGGEGLVGWGVAARVELAGPHRFADAQAWWDDVTACATVTDEVGLPGTGLVAFGSFGFDPQSSTSVLVVPEVLIGHRDGTWWLTRVSVAGRAVDEPLGGRPPARPPAGLRFEDDVDSGQRWVRSVTDAIARIETGDLAKVVLARDVHVRADEPVDVRWPLTRLAADYPTCWTFSVDGLLGATPEMLVRLVDGVASSRVLAGTLRRSGDVNEDLRRAQAFQGSIKDIEEHGYAVRSVTEAFALHAASVEVPDAPFVLELPNVLHLASDITAEVAPTTSVLGLVSALHPSAAVCGTPTALAIATIREVEGLDRGRYAGPVGWVDARGDGEWGIALRCASVEPGDPSRLRMFAGCGIVAGSHPLDELAETTAKLVPMRTALQP